tara:strand:+ start:982 stop:1293 length:312 start_codon:yes stop_codon:yes gene_type:complete
MTREKLFTAMIEEEFSVEVALAAINMLTLNLNKKMKKRHFIKGKYTEELEAKFKKHFHEISDEARAEAISLWKAVHFYEISHTLTGLGGRDNMTFREIIAENS